MQPLLYLTHRLPYPPNKGDKVRSYHLLRYLAARHRVFLGTFIDDPADEAYVEKLSAMCADIHIARISPSAQRIKSLRGLLSGEALTLPYYRDAGLASWVRETIRREGIGQAVIFSSAMAQYLRDTEGVRTVIDFCDVDSAKWTQYAPRHMWPLSWIYTREGKRLLDFEAAMAARADASLFVTEAEVALFKELAPAQSTRAIAVPNGVDTDFFSPDPQRHNPYSSEEAAVVFTGAMDYWPNIDAVCWFAAEIWPAIKAKWGAARFYIVGMRPAPAVQALAGPDIVVTGTVPDVRPYLQHARVVVAPLRVARGIQNKVLEAMSMEQAVVVAKAPAAGLGGMPGRDYAVAEGAEEFARVVLSCADQVAARSMGKTARAHVLAHYQWGANLASLDKLLAGDAGAPNTAASAPVAIPG
jgi:polysaccharide biosynthesis protein PslH